MREAAGGALNRGPVGRPFAPLWPRRRGVPRDGPPRPPLFVHAGGPGRGSRGRAAPRARRRRGRRDRRSGGAAEGGRPRAAVPSGERGEGKAGASAGRPVEPPLFITPPLRPERPQGRGTALGGTSAPPPHRAPRRAAPDRAGPSAQNLQRRRPCRPTALRSRATTMSSCGASRTCGKSASRWTGKSARTTRRDGGGVRGRASGRATRGGGRCGGLRAARLGAWRAPLALLLVGTRSEVSQRTEGAPSRDARDGRRVGGSRARRLARRHRSFS